MARIKRVKLKVLDTRVHLMAIEQSLTRDVDDVLASKADTDPVLRVQVF